MREKEMERGGREGEGERDIERGIEILKGRGGEKGERGGRRRLTERGEGVKEEREK